MTVDPSDPETLEVARQVVTDLALRTAVLHEGAVSRVAQARRLVRNIERDREAAEEDLAAAIAERDQLRADFLMCAEGVADPAQYLRDTGQATTS